MPLLGTLPSIRNESTSPWMHLLPDRYAPCPSPSYVTSVAVLSWAVSFGAHSYGVAGSPLPPTTRIGADPVASTCLASSLPLAYQTRHSPPEPSLPNSGEIFSAAASVRRSAAGSGRSAESTQVMAGKLVICVE